MKQNIVTVILSLILVLSLASCSGTVGDAPKGMQRVSGDDVDYYFYVPDEWTPETSTGVTTAKYSDSILVNVSLMAATVNNGTQSAKDYFDEYTESFKSIYENFELVSAEDTLLDSHAAYKAVYTGSVTGVEAKYMQVVCIKSGIAYIFTYTAQTDKYDDYLSDADKMIENFAFKD